MRKAKSRRLIRQIIKLPFWLLLLLLANAVVAGALVGGSRLTPKVSPPTSKVAQPATPQEPNDLVKQITQKVIPATGYQTSLTWGDLGKRLVEVGAIDKTKYAGIFTTNTNGKQELAILEGNSDKPIEINENNSRFLVNTLWALGLTNRSRVLDEGPMQTGGTPTDRFASTAGWTLGSKSAMELYSSLELISFSDEQQEQVKRIAENVYRPCCGNSTAFPDCNHGMAALGYIELAVASGLSEEQIYRDLLAFNAYWFPTNYVELGVYFEKEGTPWEQVDPQLALSKEYSSAQGSQKVRQAVADVPGIRSQGGSCGT